MSYEGKNIYTTDFKGIVDAFYTFLISPQSATVNTGSVAELQPDTTE